MNKKKIELICVLSFIGALTVSVVAVPLGSFIAYNAYLNEIEANKPSTPIKTPKPVLQSIEAKLVEGKKYYANNLAKVVNEDFEVTAHYLTGEEKSSEVLAADKYSVSTPADFALNGGEAVITYNGKTTSVSISLIAVAIESIEVSKTPYLIKYQVGSTFDPTGMEIKAVYNDGSTKVLSSEDYTYDKTQSLNTSDKEVTITYTLGTITKTVKLPISVVTNLDNGNVVSLEEAGNTYATVGQKINEVEVNLLGKYESGNRILLHNSELTITSNVDIVDAFGKAYKVTAKYGSLTKEVNLIVRNHLEGENATLVGGKANTEAEYVFEDGVLNATGGNVSFAGNFGKAVNDGTEASIEFIVESYTNSLADMTMRCANSYLTYDGSNYYMNPLQINTIADLLVNGEKVEFPNNVILKGCGPYEEEYAPLYNVYYEFTFENLQLNPGTNKVKLQFKKSTEGAMNYWNETPSSMNIDYVNFDSKGKEITGNEKIKSIKIVSQPQINFGTQISTLDFKIISVLDNGVETYLTKDKYLVTATGEAVNGDFITNGDYVIKVTVKDNPSLFVEIKGTAEMGIIEAEKGVLSGSRVVESTENEYIYEDGEYIASDVITVVKGMDYGTTKGGASITLNINAIAGTYDLKARLDNAYYFSDGTDPAGPEYTKDLDLTQVLKIKVNGNYVTMKNVTLPGVAGTTNADHLWMFFYEEVLASIELQSGANTIVIEGNTESALRNKWNEIPVPRFDWFKLEK